MNIIKKFESFNYEKPYHKVLQDKLISIINKGYRVQVGDKVIDNNSYSKKKGREGVVISNSEWGKPEIKWEDGEVTNSPVKYSGAPSMGYNFILANSVEEFEKIQKEYKDLIGVVNRVDIENFIADLKNDMTSEELVKKYKLTDKEYRYLIDSPIVRFKIS